MKRLALALGVLILLAVVPASAQNVELVGGGSSLFNAEGATAMVRFVNSETEMSGGVLDGHTYAGAIEKFNLLDWKIEAGDVHLPFDLVTDFATTNYQFPAVGLLTSHKLGDGRVTLFAGATATQYYVPFFFGNKVATPTTGIFYERPLNDKLTFLSSEVLSTGKQSAIQALQFKPVDHLTLAASSGVGSNSPFVSGRAAYETQRWTGIVSWTKHTPSFERIVVPNYSVTENNGLEARGAFNGHYINAMVDRENILSDVRGMTVHSTIDTLGLSGHVSFVSGSATGFYGTSNGQIIRGATAGIAATLGPITGRFDTYSSLGQVTHSVTIAEKLTRHFSVNQFVTGHGVNFGASYNSNLIRASGGYSMSFLPALGTFQKVLSVSVSIQLPHSVRVDGGTVTTPDGRTRWTGYATTYQQGPMTDIIGAPGQHSTGKYMYKGRCVTEAGDPVSCAVRIGKTILYADSTGEFRLPTKKMRTQRVTVMPEEFISPGDWQVVTVPTTATPETPITIVLRRVVAVAHQ